ncbi:hypothetical protein MGSAQ_001150 [marine sediment metagenome]|uniref:Uncharacterized protein n=1 Tax=marine sediment metagenome TaxID=412755 RepID=A0A1B6NV78_9ZZZZ
MAIGGGRGHAGAARGLGQGKGLWALLLDQIGGRLDQGLAQVAVVIGLAVGGDGRGHYMPSPK